MSFFSEFKSFAMRGNVIDLAVGVIIGGAFGKIISSLVEGIIMPVIGLILGGIDITVKTITVGHAVIKWGAFLQSVIDFTLIAFSIFLFIKLINMVHKKEEAQPSQPSNQELLLIQIRDLLKKNTEK